MCKANDDLSDLVSDASRSNYDVLVFRWSGLKVKSTTPFAREENGSSETFLPLGN